MGIRGRKKNSVILIRLNRDLKRAAGDVLDRIGFNTSHAVRLFLKAVVEQDELPFEINKAFTDAVMERKSQAEVNHKSTARQRRSKASKNRRGTNRESDNHV